MNRLALRWSLVVSLAVLFTVNLWWWWTAERAWVDDAWISFRYARSLLDGHGFSYNVEDGPLEGFTNLAWVLMTALAMKLGAAPELFTRIVGISSHLAAVGLIASLGWRRGARPPVVLLGTVLLAAIPGTTWGLLGLAGSGLETPFAALLIVLLAELTERFHVGAVVATSSLLAATRPDGLLFVGAFFLVLAPRLRTDWKPLVKAGLGFAAFFLALQTWRWLTFHSLVPNTYFAKSANLPVWELGWAYWWAVVRSEPGVALLFAVAVLGALRLRAWAGYAALSLSLYVVYVAKVGGDFMAYRFAYQVIPLVAWAVARLLVDVERTPSRLALAAVGAGGLGLAYLPPLTEVPNGFAPVAFMNELAAHGLRVGRALHTTLPPQTRIATTLAGTLPYEFGGFTVDQWGLTDAYIGHLPDVPVKVRGHVKLAPESYLRERSVNLVVGHPHLCSCSRRCDSGEQHVYVRIDGDECLRTRYLTPTPELTRLFCSDPRFVVSAVDCNPEPQPSWRLEGDVGPAPTVTDAPFTPLELAAFSKHGAAFGNHPATGPLPGQQRITGYSERLMNSFHGGDSATGWLLAGPWPQTRLVRGRVGGGRDCTRVYVGALQDGTVSNRHCGDDREVLREFLLRVPAGAQLVIADFANAGWGHLLVSDLMWAEAE